MFIVGLIVFKVFICVCFCVFVCVDVCLCVWMVMFVLLEIVLRVIFVFDFDGVVCDFVGEFLFSVWKYGEELWFDVFDVDVMCVEKEWVFDGLCVVWLVVEIGYENITLARALLERLSGYLIEEILNDWDGLLGVFMDKWLFDWVMMVEVFGRIWDDWILNDFDGWLVSNALYSGVVEAVFVV